MSALPPKADIRVTRCQCCFGPEAVVSRRNKVDSPDGKPSEEVGYVSVW
jgi:hypothetical protein